MFGISPCLYARVINADKHNNKNNIYYIIYIYINYALLFPFFFKFKRWGLEVATAVPPLPFGSANG